MIKQKQTAERYPVFTENALRWQLHRRSMSGLSKTMIKLEQRVYEDSAAFETWLEDLTA